MNTTPFSESLAPIDSFHATPGEQPGVVVQYPNMRKLSPGGHEKRSLEAMAERLAALRGQAWGDDDQGAIPCGRPRYFVPDDTLTCQQAGELGIHSEKDLFGAVVPHAYMASKLITHSLVREGAAAPVGWIHELGTQVAPLVLPGFSAFSLEDACTGIPHLLERGPVRVKLGSGIGGNGQYVVGNQREWEKTALELDSASLARDGMVIEQHLEDIVTYSVGMAVVGPWRITYAGTQQLTRDHAGHLVYGGSALLIVRGGFAALLRQTLPSEVRTAVILARRFDSAMLEAIPDFIGSRRNYDVIRGRDAQGKWLSGVLEQSWRVGGATPAEIAAMEAFKADRSLRIVRARCVEDYSGDPVIPSQAVVHFSGMDPRAGALTKYSYVERYTNPS